MNLFVEAKKTISENKNIISGISIFLVILYHSSIYFYPCFIGVDFFMFMSGYFLCFSYERYNIKVFFKRRFTRILPIYVFTAIVISALHILNGKSLTILDIVYNVTTLSYYGLGSGDFIDWYLSALFLFYLLFPLFYYLMCSKYNHFYIVLFLISIMFLFAFVDIHWKYECAIGRLPIFCFGILAMKEGLYNYKKSQLLMLVFLMLIIPSYLLYRNGYHIHTFFFVYLIAPAAFFSLCYIVLKYRFSANGLLSSFFEKLGIKSLEIYAANVIAMEISIQIYSPQENPLLYLITSLSLTLLVSAITICFNRVVQKYIKLNSVLN